MGGCVAPSPRERGRASGPDAASVASSATAASSITSASRAASRVAAAAISSSCVPTSTTRPPSRTTIWSASRTVESRWAIAIVVRPSTSRVERLLHEPLGLRVERRGRLVEHEDRRVAQDRARDREPLLLAAREAVAALADDRVVALRQRRDQRRGSAPRARPPRPPRRSRPASRSAGCRARSR